MSITSKFYINGVDLSMTFYPYTSGTQASTTGFKVSGVDLNTFFAPYTSGETTASTTGFKVSGVDLNTLFSRYIPEPPTNVSATASTYSTATVSFTTSSRATSYTVTSSPGSITATGTSSPITVSGLTENTSYTFTITATNTGGTSSAASASSSITTPSAFTTTFLTTKSVTFSTPTANTNIPGYYIACNSTGQYVTFVADSVIYVSTNYGSSFTSTAVSNYMYAVTMSSSGQYQLAVSTGVPASGIYVSSNYGSTWTLKLTSTTLNAGRWFQSVCMDSTGQYMYCSGGGGAGLASHISSDYGNSFSSAGGIENRVSATINNSTYKVIATSSFTGVRGFQTVTLPSTTETFISNSNVPTTYINVRITSDGGNNVFFTKSSTGYYSSDGGSTFGSAISLPTTFINVWYSSSTGYLWANTSTTIYLSKNNGTTWTTYTTALTNIYGMNISSDGTRMYILTLNSSSSATTTYSGEGLTYYTGGSVYSSDLRLL